VDWLGSSASASRNIRLSSRARAIISAAWEKSIGWDVKRAGRWQDHKLCAVAVELDLEVQPLLDDQAHRVQQHRQRPARLLREPARVAGGQDVDLVGAELDRMGERGVVGHAAVHQAPALELDRREDSGDGGAGHHRVDSGTTGQAQLLTAEHVSGDHVQRRAHLLQPPDPHVTSDQATEVAIGHQVIAAPDESHEAGERVAGKHGAPTQVAPDPTQLRRSLDPWMARGDEGAVDRPGRLPTIRSGAIPRSKRASSMPTWIAPRLAPPESTKARIIRHPQGTTSTPFQNATWSRIFLIQGHGRG
jgi:hypothetical protein